MHVVVLGAGIAGLTTAWYLTEIGVDVSIVDRGAAPASETSHANGGHLSTQDATPWTGPREMREFIFSRWQREPAVRIYPRSEPDFRAWSRHALAVARPARYRRATAELRRLAAYSRECFDELIRDQRLDVALERSGTMALYRSAHAFHGARRRHDGNVETLGVDDIITREPALAGARLRPAGALYYSGDATGDCRRFCEELATRLEARGVTLHWNCIASGLHFDRGKPFCAMTDRGPIEADACVVALGAEASSFMRAYAPWLPIIPLRGYTLTAPIAEGASAPGRFADAERHLVFARLGGSFRAAGMADFAGLSREAPAARLAQLERLTRDWYPDMAQPEFWTCLRPITPDGPPILGVSGVPGVWLNTGLGPFGWTLACGTGRLVADLIAGREPAIPLAGFLAERFA
ncbi:MAG: FAD-dependent oxidoreductase [Gammaproteobacteria bacterium]